MNRSYRSIWNDVTRTFVAAAETVRGRGKATSGSRRSSEPAAALATTGRRRLVSTGARPLALEQRFMFDGAAVVDAVHASADAHPPIEPVPAPVQVRAADPAQDNGKREVVFVDTSVANHKTLEAGIRAGVEIQEIDASRNGLAQIAQWARDHADYDAIHILSHGSEGLVHLGSTLLDDTALRDSTTQAELAEVGRALKPDGDLLLYGCDVAAGSDGQQFLRDLASATGADVAASTDATGAATLGGNWTLEAHVGDIDTHALAVADYDRLLTTVSITSSDVDYSSTTFTTTVNSRTITFSGGGTSGNGLGIDNGTYGSDGLYAFDANAGGSNIKLTIAIEAGYTFDLTSFEVGVNSGSLTIGLTYGNGSTTSFTTTGLSTNSLQTLNSFATAINDVKQVVLTSSDYGLFQNFEITDVKAYNAAPTNISLTVPDSSGVGKVSTFDGANVGVGTLATTDSDAGDSATYSIVSISNPSSQSVANDGTVFNLSGSTLRATTPSGLTAGNYSVTVRTTDSANNTYDKTFTVAVSNTLTVTSNSDSGADATTGSSYAADLADGGGLSLREAVALTNAAGGGTLSFGAGLASQTITLGSSLAVTGNTTLDADAAGTLTVAGSSLSIASGKTLAFHNATADSLTLASGLSGTGALTKTGTGTLSLSNTGNETAMSGDMTVIDGTLSVADGAALSAGTLTLNGGTLTVTAPSATSIANDIVLGVNGATVDAVGQTTLTGVISGSGDLTAHGTSFLAFYGDNTYTGTTTVADGILMVGHSHALGSTAGATVVANGATLGVVDNLTVAENISMGGTGLNGTSGALRLGASTLTGNIALTANTTLTAIGDATLAGAISGSYSVTKEGVGTLTFSGANTYSGSTTVSAGGLTLSGGAALADSSALSVASGSTVTLASAETVGSLAGAGNVALGGSTLTAGGNNGSTTFSGVMSGSGGLAKTGSGTLTLSGTNTYTGSTGVSGGGTLSVTSHTNVGSGTLTLDGGTLTVTGAGTMFVDGQVNANTTLNEMDVFTNAVVIGSGGGTIAASNAQVVLSGALTGSGTLTKTGGTYLNLLNADGFSGNHVVSGGNLEAYGTSGFGSGSITLANGTHLYVSGSSRTIANNIVLTGNATVNLDAALYRMDNSAVITFSGVISESGGARTLTLQADDSTNNNAFVLSGANTYTGTTAIAGNTRVQVSANNNLGAGTAVTMAGGATLAVTGSTTLSKSVALNGAGTVEVGSGLAVTASGVFSGANALTKTGAGTLTLSGTNTSTGLVTVSAGELALSGGAAIHNTASVVVSSGATLRVSNAETVKGVSGAGNVVLDATLTMVNSTTSYALSGVVSGSGGLTINGGSGVVTLSGDNTYSGVTTVTSGVLLANHNNALGSTSSGTVVSSGGTVQIGDGVTLSESFTLSGSGYNNTYGALKVTGTATVSGNVALAANSTVYSGINASLTVSGILSGNYTLTKFNPGTLVLRGDNSNWSGGITVTGGLLQAGHNNALGNTTGTTTVSSGAGLVLSSGVTVAENLVLSGIGPSSSGALRVTSGSATHTGTITLSGNSFIGVASGASLNLTGVISGSAGLNKVSPGTLTLGGLNTYTGGTSVGAGTLLVTGALGGTSSVTVGSGATLGGTGSVFASNSTNTLTVNSGGTLSPGVAGSNQGAGRLTVNGNLTMATGSTLAVDIAGSTAGSGYDQVVVNGAVDLGGATLTATHAYTAGSSDVYTVIANDGSDTITNTFIGLAEGATLTAAGNGTVLTARYTGDSGNDVTLTSPVNNAPTLGTVTGASAAWAGVGQSVLLDLGAMGAPADTELDALNGGLGDWAGASVSLQRVTGGANDASAHDVFAFSSADFTVSGNTLQSGGQTFATFSNAGGVLSIAFTSSGTTATSALVQSVLRGITYRNDTPYGDTTLRFTLSDGLTPVTADVTVTSASIYVDSTSDADSEGDAADGFSLREALARSVSQSGADTVTVVLADHSSITLGSGVTLGSGDTLDLSGADGLTVSGSTVTLASGSETVTVGTGKSATLASAIDGTGGLGKAGAGTLTLSGTNTYTGSTTVSAGTLAISSDAHLGSGDVSLNGGTLEVTGVITVDNNVVLAADSTFKINHYANFTGVVSGSGTLTKTGTGNLGLSGANTYTGETDLTEGYISADSDQALGTAAGGTVIADGASLHITASSGATLSDAIRVAGTGADGFGAIRSYYGASTLTGAVTLTGDARIEADSSSTLTLNGGLTDAAGSYGLTKSLSGNLVLSGAASYDGTTTVTGGTLTVTGDSTLGSGAVTLNGGTLSIGGNTTIDNAITLGSNGATVTTANAVTLSGALGGTGTLTKAGSGTVTLSGTNTYTGSTTVAAGTLALSGGSAVADTGAVNVNTGATLSLSSDETLGAMAGSGNVSLGSSTLTAGGNHTNTVFSGTISGTGGLTKAGTGELDLTGSNTYTGATTVSGGTLWLENGSAIADASAVTVASGATLQVFGDESIGSLTGTGTVTLNGGTLTLGGDNGSTTFSGTIDEVDTGALNKIGTGTFTISGSNAHSYTGTTRITDGTLAISSDGHLGSGSVTLNGGTLAVSGYTIVDNDLVLSQASTIQVDGYFDATGVVSGSGQLTKTGSGNLMLEGANTYTGATVISAGYVTATSAQSLGTSAGGTTIASGATLHLNNASGVTLADAISVAGSGDDGFGAIRNFQGSSTLSGLVTLTGDARIEADSANTLTLSGGITDGAGSYGLSKSLSGNLVLSGTASYDGTTQVTGGTLTITDDSTLGTGAVTLNSGTLSIAGNATVDNAITLGSNGATVTTANAVTLSGALSGTGTLTKAGSGTVTLSGTNTYTGSTTVAAGTLALSGGSAVTDGTAVSVASGATLSLGSDETIGSLSGSGAVSLGSSTLTTGGDATSTTFAGIASGTGGLSKTGTGTFTLTGANTYSGATTVSAGTLLLDGAGDALADSGAVSVADGATLSVRGAETLGSLAGAGALTLNGGALTIGGNNSSTTFSGTVQEINAGGLIKVGSGTWTVSGTHEHSGGTTVRGGTLAIGGDAQLGSGTLTLNGGTLSIGSNTTIDNAVLLGSNGGTVNTANAVTLSGVVSGGGTFGKAGSGTVTLSGSNTFSGDTAVNAGTLALSGGSALNDIAGVTVASGATLSLGSAETLGTLDGAGTVALGANTLTLSRSANSTVSGTISGTGGLTKDSNGTLTLSGTNTFTGATLLNAGTLLLTSGTALADTAAVTVASGATLSVRGSETLGSVAGAGTITLNGGTLTVGGDNTSTTFSGLLNETGSAGALTKAGTGTFTLSGTNTYTGITTVTGGTLSVATDANLGSGSITLNGGTLSVSSAATIDNAIALGSNNATVNTAHAVTLSGAITGTGSLTKAGTGTLTLSGTNNFSGDTAVNAGTLALSGGSALADTVGVTVATGATLSLGSAETIGTLDGAGNVALGANTLTLSRSANSTVSGTISGTGGLTKNSNGTLTLSGTNTYTGITTVTAGTLSVASDDNLGSGSITLNGGTLSVSSDATIDNAIALGSNNATVSTAHAVTLSGAVTGTGSLTKAGTGTLTLSGTNTFSGDTAVSAGTLALAGGSALADTAGVTVASGATLSLGSAETIGTLDGAGTVALGANTLTLSRSANSIVSGTISGTGGLTKNSNGALTLSGTNTFTGATTVNAGVLSMENGSAIADASAVTVASGASLFVYGDETIGSLAGSGTVTLNGGTLTVGGNHGSTTFSGTIDELLTGALTKTGTGTLTLAGATSYSGTTTVSAGTLSLTGTLAGDATVSSGATLAGTGTVGGGLNVDSGATLTPGVDGVNLGIGMLNVTGALQLNGTLAIEVAGTTSHDQVVASGAVTLGSHSSVGVHRVNNASATQTAYTVIDHGGSGSVTGTFDGLAEGDRLTTNGDRYTVHYAAGTGNDLVLDAYLNSPPTLTAGTTTAFTEQTPVAVAGSLTLLDSDGDASWDGGSLSVQITHNATADDSLGLPVSNPGGSALWIDANGLRLMAGTVQIGTASAVSAGQGTAWTFTFNANATNALVQATARAITFDNGGDTPATADRTVTFTATDSAAASAFATQTISVTAMNDTPTLSAGTASAALVEAGGVGNATAGTAASSITLTQGDVDGTASFDTAYLVNQGWTTVDSGATYTRAGTYGTATFTIATGVVSYTLDNSAAATQALTAGQSVSETFTVQVTDGTATQSVDAVFSITGANDAPTLSAGSPSAALVEAGGVGNATAGTDTSSITLTKADVDGTASFDTAYLVNQGWTTADSGATYSRAGTYGTATFTVATGVASYALDNGAAATQALTAGQSVSETFTVRVTDGSATQSADAVFSITGANDAPTLSAGSPSAALIESGGVGNATAGTDTSSITLTKGDGDGSASFDTAYLVNQGWTTADSGATYTRAGTYGTTTFTVSTGVVSYALDNSAAATQALTAGQSVSETFTVQVTDGVATQSVDAVFSITGANDAPSLSAGSPSDALVEAGGVANAIAGTATSTIALTKTDVDGIASFDTAHLVNQGWTTADSGATYSRAGTYGTATLTVATGVVSYALDNNAPATQALTAGQSVNETFTVQVTDGTATRSADAVFSITGANDAPTLNAGSPSAALIEAGTATSSITLTKADVDGAASFDTAYLINQGWTTADSGATYTRAGTYGTATFTIATGVVSYTLDNSAAATQALTAGQGVSEAFTVQVTDGTATRSADAVFSITGANDAPTLSAGSPSAVLVEAGGANNATAGTAISTVALTKGDVDGTASYDTAYLFNQGWTTADSGATYTRASTYGTATFTVATGVVSYALDNSAAATQALTAGQSVSETFTVQVTDGTATRSADVVFSITGANDAPILSAGSPSAALVEAGGVANATAGTDTSSITLTKGDVDGTASYDTADLVNQGWTTADSGATYTRAGTYGTATFTVATGVVSYALDNSRPATQRLTADDSVTDTFTVQVTDGTASRSAQVVFTIAGAADAPSSIDDTASATEAGGVANATAGVDPSGNVLANDTDVDGGDALQVSAVRFGDTAGTVGTALAGRYGSLTLRSDGSYDYVVNNGDAAVQALLTGADTLTEVFHYTARDSAGQTHEATLTLTIHGANDAVAPAQSMADQQAREDAPFQFTVPALAFTDADAGDTPTFTATLASGDALPTWLHFDAATRTFSGTPGNDDVGTLQLRVAVQDAGGTRAEATFRLTVANTDDAPRGAVTVTGQAMEAGTLTVAHTLSDPDGLGNVTYRWQTSADGTQWTDLPGASGDRLVVTDAMTGLQVRAVATYVDGRGTPESVASNATEAVQAVPKAPLAPPAAPPVPAPAPAPAPMPPVEAPVAAPTLVFLPASSPVVADLRSSVPGMSPVVPPVTTPAAFTVPVDATRSSAPPSMTQGGSGSLGFPVLVIESGAGGAQRDGLVVLRGMGDLAIGTDRRSEISVPADAFAHSDARATVQLSAQQADGRPLPNWMRFDPTTGKFSVQPPSGMAGEITVRVVARDAEGHQAVTTFKVKVGAVPRPGVTGFDGAADRPVPSGRLGLSEQIRLSAQRHGGTSMERLAQGLRAAMRG